jgi:hypothetical protein
VFREPLRRDPLVVAWALVMVVAVVVALSSHTTWSGHLEADRVAGFLRDVAEAFLWSFFVLLLLAWLRAKGWRNLGGGPRPARSAQKNRFEPYPWTDRWLRDWREAESQHRAEPRGDASPNTLPQTCRHGVPVDDWARPEQAPGLRALSVSHAIVRPGANVSVTWCFEGARDVVVDGRPGYPFCGEALVPVHHTRRVELVGRNWSGATPVATAAVVAMDVPQVHLPPVDAPPSVNLRTDVAASVAAAAPITRRLDDFWATQNNLRPRLETPGRLVGVPTTLIEGLRRTRRPKQED